MLCAFRIAVMSGALFFLHAAPAEARRVALVIGEAPLASPLTDAAAVAEALKNAFEREHSPEGAFGNDPFLLSLYQLVQEAEGAEIAVFFGTGANVLACHRGGSFGEEASCATFYFAN
jgi:hypothetical protein